MTTDPGLQRERTVLSWERTTGCLLANIALLIARRPDKHLQPFEVATVVIGVVTTVAFVAAARRRRHSVAPLPPPATAALALCVAVFAAAVAVSILPTAQPF